MASILDLPDECLVMICKKLEYHEQQYWSSVCKRFEYIYFEYFHNWIEVNDDFPLQIINRLHLTESKCTKFFLNKLRDCHKEIEEAKLFSFTDEYLAELLPLPNLKKLIYVGSSLRGRSLIEINSLTDLHIYSNRFIDPKYLLQITYCNPLRTLVVSTDTQMFSNGYAFEMVENLNNVEELEITFNPCKSWQLIGTLPKLKKLTVWNFKSDKCETCLKHHNLNKRCVGQHATLFFDELRRRNQLEELVLFFGNVSEQLLLRISELTNLKRLKLFCFNALPIA
ncbi:uncharacterized protein LOC128922003 isoform X3 [Zeugodacus cucurbitae]|uniref:uncharacterized protein LOC128922003 isoform X3 n=1 Tax=Zeugodacus cucurbitae TaxID=28588 RepID=UPI0023D9359B|nr:uncharacterized protein LOC128922003 isoform X3 [Zeugodacus cucurbitae]